MCRPNPNIQKLHVFLHDHMQNWVSILETTHISTDTYKYKYVTINLDFK